jgi:hypothetical protein
MANGTTSLLIAPFVPDAVVIMEGKDRRVVFLGVIVVALSVLLGTVFALGPMGPLPPPMDDFIADWSTQERTQTANGLNDQVVDFDVMEQNLTRISVHLTWQDDELVSPIGRRDDTLGLRVEGPPGVDVDDQVSGTSGDLELTFDLAPVPTDDEAGNIADYLNEDATGTWTITVSVQPAGLRDNGNDWSVSISYTFYTGRLIDNPEVV